MPRTLRQISKRVLSAWSRLLTFCVPGFSTEAQSVVATVAVDVWLIEEVDRAENFSPGSFDACHRVSTTVSPRINAPAIGVVVILRPVRESCAESPSQIVCQLVTRVLPFPWPNKHGSLGVAATC